MCASGRHASHEWRAGIDTETRGCRLRRSGDGLVGQDDAFRLARSARGGHNERIALFDGFSVGERVLLAVGGDDAGRPERVEHGAARDAREPRVERCGSVTGVPDGAERVDEPHPAWEIECDELGHWPVA